MPTIWHHKPLQCMFEEKLDMGGGVVVPFLANHTVAGQGCVLRCAVSHWDAPIQSKTDKSKCRIFSQDEKKS